MPFCQTSPKFSLSTLGLNTLKKRISRIHIYYVSSLMSLTLSLVDLAWTKYTIRLHQQVQKWNKLILEKKPL